MSAPQAPAEKHRVGLAEVCVLEDGKSVLRFSLDVEPMSTS